jgi:hypothetical protein
VTVLLELQLPPALSAAWAWLPCAELMGFCLLGQWGGYPGSWAHREGTMRLPKSRAVVKREASYNISICILRN